MLPKDTELLQSFISGLSDDAYYEGSKSLKGILIDEVDCEEKQYLITIDLRNNQMEFIDDIVNPEHYEINSDEWNKMICPLQSAVMAKGCKFIIDNKGNDDYLWASLRMPINLFNESTLNELTKLWMNFNNSVRNKK